jgi:anhydro-N-acetylmuramic acid kinase
MSPRLYIGLMSGTSLDGIDAVLADFTASETVVTAHYEPFPPELRTAIAALLEPGHDEIGRCATVANELALRYAAAAQVLIAGADASPAEVRAIGCHGQTVRHQPQHGYTSQLVNGALLAESTGIGVVCDFRSRDIAAGGQGAPLVPAYHQAMFSAPGRDRVVVNLGGIANLTWLPRSGEALGFDCGPGNALLDEWIALRRGLAFDDDGAWAATGNVIPALLQTLLAHPFFAATPPKSTGRETFNLAWAQGHLQDDYAAADVQATLAELTASSVAGAITWCGRADEVFVCGGGAHNRDLLLRLGRLLPAIPVASTAALGADPDWVEALAFAWLARELIEGRCGNLPSVTGAKGPRPLGCIYPA